MADDDRREHELMRIGELARRTDKTVRALHHYEELDLLVPAKRSKGGFRLYDEGNLDRIEYIDRLQRLGFSLAEVRELVRDWTTEAIPAVAMSRIKDAYRARLADVRERLGELQRLERELADSLAFLEGCRTCGVAAQPHHACGGCARTDEAADEALTLITGLTAR
ncbi:MAG: MerR family transcriptional regulator [bacterium]|nr:MerR family transcriptional regulator [Myxococcales bacterium]MCB9552624.1 MerR family transcriptional regulator [Myxococcales bacterium]